MHQLVDDALHLNQVGSKSDAQKDAVLLFKVPMTFAHARCVVRIAYMVVGLNSLR